MGRRREISDINLIVIHCSATPNGRWTTAADIDGWHKTRGFSRDMSIAPHHEPALNHIGYHFLILTTGAVCCGRPLIETGSHARDNNGSSIGVCLVGTDRFSPAQWDALSANIRSLAGTLACARGLKGQASTKSIEPPLRLLRDAGIQVRGHRDLGAKKICPGFDVRGWIERGMRPHEDHVDDV